MENDTIFRILAAITFFAGAAISIRYRHKANREGGEKLSLTEEGRGIVIVLRTTGLLLWLSVFAYLINPAWMAWSKIDLPEWIRWVGLSMGVLSVGLIYWVFSNLGNNVSPTVVTRKNHTLVTSGPYRWVRHPLYTTGFLSYIGFILLSENAFIAVMVLIGMVFLRIRLPKEEAHLIERFGDAYRDYMRRTGTFLPKIMR